MMVFFVWAVWAIWIDLRDRSPPLTMHWLVRQQWVLLVAMGQRERNQLSSLCLALMAGARVDQRPGVVELLARVKIGSLNFDPLRQQIGPHIAESALPEPQLLSSLGSLRLTEASCRSRMLNSKLSLALYGWADPAMVLEVMA